MPCGLRTRGSLRKVILDGVLHYRLGHQSASKGSSNPQPHTHTLPQVLSHRPKSSGAEPVGLATPLELTTTCLCCFVPGFHQYAPDESDSSGDHVSPPALTLDSEPLDAVETGVVALLVDHERIYEELSEDEEDRAADSGEEWVGDGMERYDRTNSKLEVVRPEPKSCVKKDRCNGRREVGAGGAGMPVRRVFTGGEDGVVSVICLSLHLQ